MVYTAGLYPLFAWYQYSQLERVESLFL